MSNQHKHPTISFRVSDAERKQIEARILASGMMKKDYFARSCIYNRICVVGKKETIYPLVQTVNALYLQLLEMHKAFVGYCQDQNPDVVYANDSDPFILNCQKCNSSVILDNPNDIVYLYRLAQDAPLLYAELALKADGLQRYVDAMNEFN